MAAKGEARAKISLDYSGWELGAKAVAAISKQMFDVVKTTVGVAFGMLAVDAIKKFVSAIPGAVSQVLQMGEELANMAHATGMAAGQFAAFQLMLQHGISYADASSMLGRNAELLSKDANIFRDVQIKIAESGLRIQGFWIGFADKIAPVMNVLLDKFNSLDLSKWGQQFAEPIANAAKVIYGLIASGNVGNIFGAGLKLAALQFNSILTDGTDRLIAKLHAFFDGLPGKIKAKTDGLTEPLDDFTNDLADRGHNMLFGRNGGWLNSWSGNFDSGMKLPSYGPLKRGQKGDPTEDAEIKGLSSQIKQMIEDAKKAFQGDSDVSKQFENRYAKQNFGVSNLQKIGGGGFFGGVQDSVQQRQLDVQIESLNVQKQFLQKFQSNDRGANLSVPSPAYFWGNSNVAIV